MKNSLVIFTFFVLCAAACAAPQMVFFGDSLSDNGNLYTHSMKIIPKSPPYFNGRFSNGRVWSENLALNYNYKSQIYAVGGATAVFHIPTTRFAAPTTLTLEIYKYILDTLYTDRSNNLYVIWIGDNDYMFYQNDNPDESTTRIVNSIISDIVTLSDYGARKFLIINLMDTTRTPFIQANGNIVKLHHLIVLHNRKLHAAIKLFKSSRPDTKFAYLDAYAFFNDLLDNTEKYNELYHTHITDTRSACWRGGLTYKALAQQRDEFTLDSTELDYTWLLDKSLENGNIPCSNPNEHIFWDDMHPTAIFHQMMAQIAADTLKRKGIFEET